MKRTAVLLALAALLLVANGVAAMSSAGYKLEWFTPATSGGGGSMASANYAVRITVGQSAVGGMDSAAYGACLGYWCGMGAIHTVFLPLVIRGS